MNDNELRDRLKRLDPMHPGVPTEPVTASSSRERLERIMSTTTTERPSTRPTPSRRPWYAAVAAVTVAAVAVAGVLVFTGRGGEGPSPVAAAPLELSLGASDSMASCIIFDVAILAGAPVAFEGTATAVDGDQVTLTVDRWYKGGDATTVTLTGTPGMEALIGGIPFTVGGHYLVSATDGIVNYCGYTGEATPELRAAFEQAFTG